MTLSRASTKITLGNGDKTYFWHDNWCDYDPLHLLHDCNKEEAFRREGDHGKQLDSLHR
jgi:hypothetical protein